MSLITRLDTLEQRADSQQTDIATLTTQLTEAERVAGLLGGRDGLVLPGAVPEAFTSLLPDETGTDELAEGYAVPADNNAAGQVLTLSGQGRVMRRGLIRAHADSLHAVRLDVIGRAVSEDPLGDAFRLRLVTYRRDPGGMLQVVARTALELADGATSMQLGHAERYSGTFYVAKASAAGSGHKLAAVLADEVTEFKVYLETYGSSDSKLDLIALSEIDASPAKAAQAALYATVEGGPYADAAAMLAAHPGTPVGSLFVGSAGIAMLTAIDPPASSPLPAIAGADALDFTAERRIRLLADDGGVLSEIALPPASLAYAITGTDLEITADGDADNALTIPLADLAAALSPFLGSGGAALSFALAGSSANVTEGSTVILSTMPTASGGTAPYTYSAEPANLVQIVSGRLEFIAAPVFDPDNLANNAVDVTLTATDSASASISRTLTTNILAALETPTLSLVAGDGQITWTVTPHASTGTLTGVIVERATAEGGPYTEIQGASTTLSAADTGLTNGTAYYYRARVETAAGTSRFTGAQSKVPAAPTVPTTQLTEADIMATTESKRRYMYRVLGFWRPEEEAALETLGPIAWTENHLARTPYSYAPFMRDGASHEALNVSAAITASHVVGPTPALDNLAGMLDSLYGINTATAALTGPRGEFPRFDYFDMLRGEVNGTFTSFMTAVDLHPIMGAFLSHAGSAFAGARVGTTPDENKIREDLERGSTSPLMWDDECRKLLDQQGNAIPVYNEQDVTDGAPIKTGMIYAGTYDHLIAKGATAAEAFVGNSGINLNPKNGTYAAVADVRTLTYKVAFADKGAHEFIGISIPADLTYAEKQAILYDGLRDHPSTAGHKMFQMAAYIASPNFSRACGRQLTDAWYAGQFQLPNGTIKGTGEAGDLQACIWAIWWNEELNFPETYGVEAAVPAWAVGKYLDPIQRLTALHANMYRPTAGGFVNDEQPSTDDAAFRFSYLAFLPDAITQASRGVFWRYPMDYIAPGTNEEALGLYAPEFAAMPEGVYAEVKNQIYGMFLPITDARNIYTNNSGGAGLNFVDFETFAAAVRAENIVSVVENKAHTFADGSKGHSFLVMEDIHTAPDAAWDAAKAGGATDAAAHDAAVTAIIDTIAARFSVSGTIPADLRTSWELCMKSSSTTGSRAYWGLGTHGARLDRVCELLRIALASPYFGRI